MTDEDQQQEGEQDEPERDRPAAITTYDSSAALRNKNVAAEKASEERRKERAEAENSKE